MPSEQLLLMKSVAEELKLPLMQIARLSEFCLATRQPLKPEECLQIQTTADMAMLLIDSYLLGLELQGQTKLALEPVSLADMVYHTAQQLKTVAQQYKTTVLVAQLKKCQPVIAHRTGIQAALLSLGYALISTARWRQPTQELTFEVRKTNSGIRVGVYGDFEELTGNHLERARELYGKARQPLQVLQSGSAAGVFVADSILHAMSTKLQVAQYKQKPGLAALFQPSRQLLLV